MPSRVASLWAVPTVSFGWGRFEPPRETAQLWAPLPKKRPSPALLSALLEHSELERDMATNFG